MSILTSLFSWAVRLLGSYRDRTRSILFCFVCFNGLRLCGQVAENGGFGWWFWGCVRKVMGSGFHSLSAVSDYSYFVCNVAYGLLTVGGVLTVLNTKTNALKCSIEGIFLTKGITQHSPQ